MYKKRLLSILLVLSLILPLIANALAVGETTGSQVSDSSAVKQAVRSTSGQTGYDRGYTGGMAGTGQYVAFGLDVSAWQGENLDFNMIKNAGYDYVILRAGTTYGKDTQFENFYVKAKAAGLDVGAYYFSYALDVATVTKDAENMISYLAGKKFEYPIYFDYEDPSQLELSSSLSQQICLTFMDMLAAEGYLVGLYTGKYFSTQIPISTICAKYEIWIAHYLQTGDGVYDGTDDYTYYGPSYSTQYGMFQFTDSVWINGNGHYDGDVAYKDYPAIVKEYGFNGYEAQGGGYLSQCSYYPAHCQINVTREQAPVNSLPCSTDTAGSVTLEYAPSGSTYTATGLYQNGYGNYWYQVITKGGETGYIYGGEAYYVKELTSDITLTDYSTPNSHVSGSKFYVEGIISSQYNRLNSAAVWVHSGYGTSGSKIIGGSDTVSGNYYDLENSTIDFACTFNEVSTGNYTYAVSVNYTNYYAEGAKTLKENTNTLYLYNEYFVVIPTAANQTSCSHSYTTTNLGSGGCNTPVTVVKACSKCGYIMESQSTGGHSYGDWVVSPATCTADGYQVRTCSACGSQEMETIPAHGEHSWNEGTVAAAAGCITNGSKIFACTECGTTKTESIPAKGHTWMNPSCLASSTCSICGQSSGAALGHDYATTVLAEPGCTTEGLRSYNCSRCSAGYTESIPRTGHELLDTVTNPTCTTPGYTTHSCANCSLSYRDSVTMASGHHYASQVTTPAGCKTNGVVTYSCTECGDRYTRQLPSTGHSYTGVVTEPTCTEGGYTTYTCDHCGKSYLDSLTDPVGHSYVGECCSTCGQTALPVRKKET